MELQWTCCKCDRGDSTLLIDNDFGCEIEIIWRSNVQKTEWDGILSGGKLPSIKGIHL